MEQVTPDRLRFLIDTIIDALDEKIDGDALAKRAYLSRFHFDRLVARGLGEAPAAFRRRLLLERAAWQCDRGEWDDAFVDALCEPPQSFTYGSVVAHVIEHSAHRRGMIVAALQELGVSDVDSSCAIDWEKRLNA